MRRILLAAVLFVSACRAREEAPSAAPPPAPAAQSAPAAAADVVVPPRAIESPAPDWSRRPGGRPPANGGDYELQIDASGAVTNVRVVRSGGPETDALVVETFRRWRFEPATRGGVPYAVRWQVSLRVPPG